MNVRLYGIIGFFAIMHLGPLMSMVYGKSLPAGVITNLYTVVLLLLFHKKLRFKLNTPDLFFLLYILVSVVSGLSYLIPSNPFSIESFAIGIHIVILPSLCYVVGRALDEQLTTYTLGWIFFLNTFAMIVGLLLYLTTPVFYIDYVVSLEAELTSSYAEVFTSYARLGSYFGSQIIAIIAPINILILMILATRCGTLFSNPLFAGLSVGLSTVTAILSMQRAGFISMFGSVVFYYYYSRFRSRTKFILVGIAVTVFLGIIYYASINQGFLEEYGTSRLSALDEAFSSRWHENYLRGWDYLDRFPFGFGLGATSLKARYINTSPPIAEANLVRIASDTGIQGLTVFLALIFSCFARGIRNRNSFPLLAIIIIFLAQSLGTNSLDSFYVSQIFWLVLGITASLSIKRGGKMFPARSAVPFHLVLRDGSYPKAFT